MERALKEEGKDPRTQLCLWNFGPDVLTKEEHRPLTEYIKTEDAFKTPIVLHLFGLADYPQSMVLTEDDHMEFLVSLHRESAVHGADGVIPTYLEAALMDSSLLLLGYRLHDWDFRVLFRGLLDVDPRTAEMRETGVAIQLDPKEQVGILDIKEASSYLNKYFGKANIRVQWGKRDKFIARLSEEWANWQKE
jgi:hypothetical protein